MKPKNRQEYREQVAQAFINVLNERGLDWKRGWDIAGGPQNAVTHRGYNGINRLHLGMIAMDRGYTDPRWCTMLQIMDKGGTYHPGQKWHLQAGSKAEYVEYWYPYDTQERKAVSWKDWRAMSAEERDDPRYALRVQYTPVFHASMIEGMPPLEVQQREPQPLDQVVSRLSQQMGVGLSFDGGDRAFYRPSEDAIHLPDRGAFHSEYELNATALHELTHATGHPSRLDRLKGAMFGTPEYAYEELIAEMGSCFMGINLDTEQMPQHMANHQAYVQSWVELLEDQPERLAAAIGEAQKAADYMEELLVEHEVTEEAAVSHKPVASIEVPEERIMEVQQQPSKAEQQKAPVTRQRKLRFTDEQYKTARDASALEYARQHGYELVRQGSYYSMKDHDSMIFTPDGRWFWNSQNMRGRAIEFLTKFEGRTLPEAVLLLNGVDVEREQSATVQQAARSYAPKAADLQAKTEKADFKLPSKASAMRHVFAYLTKTRGIDYDVVRSLAHEGRIYESEYRTQSGKTAYNAVFVGMDGKGEAHSASLRGCGTGSTFRMEVPGSDKTYPFTIPAAGVPTVLRVYESAIDAMSHATVEKLAGFDWQETVRIALGGNTKVEAIERALEAHPNITQIQFCLDHDEGGEKIYQELCDKLREREAPIKQISRLEVPLGKDWNEYLQKWRDVVRQYATTVTTQYAESGLDYGQVVGRIHYLNEQGQIEASVAYRTKHELQEAADGLIGHQAPCIVETPEQIREIEREQQFQSRQLSAQHDQTQDVEPEPQREIERQHEIERQRQEEEEMEF